MDFDEQISAYFSDEKNLHWLRTKLFNLDGYRQQSDFDAELIAYREEDKKTIESLKNQLAEELKQAEQNYNAYRTETEEKLRNVEQTKAELERWQKDYGELSAVYEIFTTLSDKHRENVAGIFGGCDTPMDFLFGAVQKVHLEQFWDYVSDELSVNSADDDSEKLSALFDFSFAAVNRSQNELLYNRLEVSQGAKFDGDTMSRTPNSPQLGRVKRLVFAGFAHKVTGKIARNSLVELEELP